MDRKLNYLLSLFKQITLFLPKTQGLDKTKPLFNAISQHKRKRLQHIILRPERKSNICYWITPRLRYFS